MTYTKPEVLKSAFTCPHCSAYSKQEWNTANWFLNKHGTINDKVIRVGQCQNCNQRTLWIQNKMFFPETGNAPIPNPEMPEKVKILYQEAASISMKSPRGAAALLRLSIQILCKELGENGQNINADIKSLVQKGLPEIVQQSLDIVRVTGNEAVHPGQINTDDLETVTKLFDLINIIIEYMIALPNKVSGIYQTLPQSKLNGIESRDNQT